MRRRLDTELVRRGLVSSRARALELIATGRVTVAGAPARSAARQVDGAEAVAVMAAANEYVSRGGHKLSAALAAFAIDATGRRALDAGASSGGFTDCLLQAGAAEVVAVDVGRGQLAWALRQDARVTVVERTNLRDLHARALGTPFDLVVVDLSFISLRLVAGNLLELATADADFVMLVKPQFEAGRERVGKGGIVRDAAVHRAVLGDVVAGLDAAGLGIGAVMPSPLLGASGNAEFLALASRGPATVTGEALDVAVASVPSRSGPE
ncbi:MAG: rRNA (cytidine1920-2-O)/16S rRNA (cytidine1409-2-O)-methyltransferase [Actinomycetota bacterium]|nr:rRNA (cytidine1920-2-O)/16S rRNA (cytidine1409-2-O)-methyltransferase [Actinomycetota bacterium]